MKVKVKGRYVSLGSESHCFSQLSVKVGQNTGLIEQQQCYQIISEEVIKLYLNISYSVVILILLVCKLPSRSPLLLFSSQTCLKVLIMAELEQFCILAKAQKGRACAALIEQVHKRFLSFR
jgi:hypothetical protein